MKGDANVIQVLNEILGGELCAINQYFMHARMCKNWGYNVIADIIYKESIDEMKHAQALVDRILFLDGIPNLQKLDKINVGEKVEEQLKSDLDVEYVALKRLKNGIDVCIAAKDHSSRDLLESILIDEEKHIDWLEAQLGIIREIGIANYLTAQLNGDKD